MLTCSYRWLRRVLRVVLGSGAEESDAPPLLGHLVGVGHQVGGLGRRDSGLEHGQHGLVRGRSGRRRAARGRRHFPDWGHGEVGRLPDFLLQNEKCSVRKFFLLRLFFLDCHRFVEAKVFLAREVSYFYSRVSLKGRTRIILALLSSDWSRKSTERARKRESPFPCQAI